MKKLVRFVFIMPIRLYQMARFGKPSYCRHYPTCSQYAIEAILSRGVIKGLQLSISRLLRCNPWGTSGFDPVPESKT